MGTLLTLILLVWQIVNFYENREEDYLDRLLVNLTDKDPLKRLIALRQLTKFISRQRVDSSVQQDVAECLQLLLSREEEVAIREAAFKSLQACDDLRSIRDHCLQVLPPKQQHLLYPYQQKSSTTFISYLSFVLCLITNSHSPLPIPQSPIPNPYFRHNCPLVTCTTG